MRKGIAGIRLFLAVTAVALPGVKGCGKDSTAPTPIQSTATLNAANERQANPVTPPATGTATLTLMGDNRTYAVTVTGLTTNALASHIHAGPPTASGPVVNGFGTTAVTTGTVAAGTIVLSALVPSNTQVSGNLSAAFRRAAPDPRRHS
ncbi:MAG: hypothetical protein NVS4B3_06960 [Gemmatimonadaceae bacterium]